MKIVTLIPARKGSKRIPNKNIKEFNGKPIIHWPIKSILKSKISEIIYVSTDYQDMSKILKGINCQQIGRKQELCNDYATSIDVAEDFSIDFNFDYDLLLFVYPTTPNLYIDGVKKAISMLTKDVKKTACVSISKYAHPIERSFTLKDNEIILSNTEFSSTRTQDLDISFHDAGNFYLFKPDFFKNSDKLFSYSSCYIEVPKSFCFDIDNKEDWDFAEKYLK